MRFELTCKPLRKGELVVTLASVSVLQQRQFSNAP